MKTKTLTKEQAVSLLTERLGCSADALAFLFNSKTQQKNYSETLKIPDQRVLN